MIRFTENWTYRTPLVTREFPKGWEGDDVTADQRKAALDAKVAQVVTAQKAGDALTDGK